MNLRFTDEELSFRKEVRAFVNESLPRTIREHMEKGSSPTADMVRTWHRILNAKGWAVPHWPVQWGGRGWSAMKRFILREEIERTPAPGPLAFNTEMCGPILIAFGNDAQKRRFLPRMANLDDWWCQGFSEPGAGSDLANLRCAARRDGDRYVVNGQKAWTTHAQHANWIFALVRTDPLAPKPQMGISFLLIEMSTPGVTVRPTITIDGAHEVNEVFFDNVKVPVENLVGQENRGWDCAKLLLSNERTGHAKVGPSKERLRMLRKLASEVISNGQPLLEDPRFASRLVDLEVRLKALEITTLRVLDTETEDLAERKPNPASSVLKICGSIIHQDISEMFVELAGTLGLSASIETGMPEWAVNSHAFYHNMRKLSIYGGSNEIQRTIMAKSYLGL